MNNFQIWYMKPEWFERGIFGADPDPKNLEATHIHLKDIKIDSNNLEDVWMSMQGERWSPNGEARELIKSKGLHHTSISVGDIIISPEGIVYMVDMLGFKQLNKAGG